jgi:hypothetical protein
LFYLILSIYFLEIIFGASGSWSDSAIGINIRKLIFIFLFIHITYIVFFQGKINFYQVAYLAFGFSYLLLAAIIVPFYMQTRVDFIFIDCIPLAIIFYLSWALTVYNSKKFINDKKYLNKLLDIVYYSTIILALIHIMLYLMLTYIPEIGYGYLEQLRLFMDPSNIGNLFIGPMEDGSIRVFWISSLFLVFGLYKSLSNVVYRPRFNQLVILGISIAGIFCTQTRSIILSVPIGIVLGWYLINLIINRYLNKNAISLLFVVILFLVTAISTFALSPEILSSIGIDREGSDFERNTQIVYLLNTWSNNLVFGVGFGGQSDYIRSIDLPFSYEMSILALFMKIGVIGFFVFFFWIGYLSTGYLNSNIRNIFRYKYNYIFFFSSIFTYWVAFNTNPYLSNSIGVSIVLLSLLEAQYLYYRSYE